MKVHFTRIKMPGRRSGQTKLSSAKSSLSLRNRTKLILTTTIVAASAVIMALIIINIPFFYKGTSHIISGRVLNQNSRSISSLPAKPIPHPTIFVYSDMDEDEQLSSEDLLLGQVRTDENGVFSIEISHGRTLITKGRLYPQSPELTHVVFDISQLPAEASIKEAAIQFNIDQNQSIEVNLQPIFNHKQSLSWEVAQGNQTEKAQSPDIASFMTEYLETADRESAKSVAFALEHKDFNKSELFPDQSLVLIIHYELKEKKYLLTMGDSGTNSKLEFTPLILPFKSNEGINLSYKRRFESCLGLSDNGNATVFSPFTKNNIQTDPLLISKASGKENGLSFHPIFQKYYAIRQGNIRYLIQNDEGQYWQKPKIATSSRPSMPDLHRLFPNPLADEIWAITTDWDLIRIYLNSEGTSILDWEDVTHDQPNFEIQKNSYLLGMSFSSDGKQLIALEQFANKEIVMRLLDMETGLVSQQQILNLDVALIQHVQSFTALTANKFRLITSEVEEEVPVNKIYEIAMADFKAVEKSWIKDGTTFNSCDCSRAKPFQFEGRIFNDLNGNKKQDSNEKGIRAVNIEVFNAENESQLSIANLRSDEHGKFLWRSYIDGKYVLRLDENTLPEGFTLTQSPQFQLEFSGENAFSSKPAYVFSATHKAQKPAVVWNSFDGELTQIGVDLKWTAQHASDGKYIEVLRSEDGINYESIGGLQANKSGEGLHEYQYKDMLLGNVQSSHVVYRLKLLTEGGFAHYSPVVQMRLESPDAGLFLSVFPNPASERVSLQYLTAHPGVAELRIMDTQGREVYKAQVQPELYKEEKQIELSSWAKGSYVVQLRHGQYTTTEKLIVK